MAEDLEERCPRCGNDEISGIMVSGVNGDACQAICDDCEHRWGDGYPDSQERPLPPGFKDCGYCDGTGGSWGYCKRCSGAGVVRVSRDD